jgi:hypothetical protein
LDANSESGIEKFLKSKLLISIQKKLKLIFSRFIVAGNNLFSSSSVEEDLKLETSW